MLQSKRTSFGKCLSKVTLTPTKSQGNSKQKTKCPGANDSTVCFTRDTAFHRIPVAEC